VVAARHRLARHAAGPHVAALRAVAVDRVVELAVVGRKAAAPQLEVAAVPGAVDPVVTVAVIFAGATQGRIDLDASVDIELEARITLQSVRAARPAGSRPERAFYAI